ncbi:MAG: hypothetical protein K6U89_08380 [Chloroflexi bacterium]|nr:hypothetical protein [Chloroflexota bacterium]
MRNAGYRDKWERGSASRRRRREGGQALLAALILIALLGVIGAALTALWFRSVMVAAEQGAATQAFYAAESAVAYAERDLARELGTLDPLAPPVCNASAPLKGGPLPVGRAQATWTACAEDSSGLVWRLQGTGQEAVGSRQISRSVTVEIQAAQVFSSCLF